jgi:histidinol phosphatase-like PHP family hydrolase
MKGDIYGSSKKELGFTVIINSDGHWKSLFGVVSTDLRNNKY